MVVVSGLPLISLTIVAPVPVVMIEIVTPSIPSITGLVTFPEIVPGNVCIKLLSLSTSPALIDTGIDLSVRLLFVFESLSSLVSSSEIEIVFIAVLRRV